MLQKQRVLVDAADGVGQQSGLRFFFAPSDNDARATKKHQRLHQLLPRARLGDAVKVVGGHCQQRAHQQHFGAQQIAVKTAGGVGQAGGQQAVFQLDRLVRVAQQHGKVGHVGARLRAPRQRLRHHQISAFVRRVVGQQRDAGVVRRQRAVVLVRQPPRFDRQLGAKAVAGRQGQALHAAPGALGNGLAHKRAVGAAGAVNHLVAVAHAAKEGLRGAQQLLQHAKRGLVDVVHLIDQQHPQRAWPQAQLLHRAALLQPQREVIGRIAHALKLRLVGQLAPADALERQKHFQLGVVDAQRAGVVGRGAGVAPLQRVFHRAFEPRGALQKSFDKAAVAQTGQRQILRPALAFAVLHALYRLPDEGLQLFQRLVGRGGTV